MKTDPKKALHNETWMWCLHCNRFVQVKDLARDWRDDPACPFCYSSGVHIDLFEWDAWKLRFPKLLTHWPGSEAELVHGMYQPLRNCG